MQTGRPTRDGPPLGPQWPRPQGNSSWPPSCPARPPPRSSSTSLREARRAGSREADEGVRLAVERLLTSHDHALCVHLGLLPRLLDHGLELLIELAHEELVRVDEILLGQQRVLQRVRRAAKPVRVRDVDHSVGPELLLGAARVAGVVHRGHARVGGAGACAARARARAVGHHAGATDGGPAVGEAHPVERVGPGRVRVGVAILHVLHRAAHQIEVGPVERHALQERVVHEADQLLGELLAHAVILLVHPDHNVLHPVHHLGLPIEVAVADLRDGGEQRHGVVHIEALDQVPDRLVTSAVLALLVAERIAEPLLVAPRRQPQPRRILVGQARAHPQILDRRALALLQPDSDRIARARHAVVDRARHRAAVGRVPREDHERHAELLAATVEILSTLHAKGVVLRGVGLEKCVVVQI
mmetsp:Transcript_1091/g.2655  ORF Transcript_1091/g.2655 Transcript_1091/m.2655 type:complete len:415 (+) Transcript_1091:50-1294(+)